MRNDLNNPTYFCIAHRVRFAADRTTNIACPSDGHPISNGFPGTEWWEYCCDCNTAWLATADEVLLRRDRCLVCERDIARRYLCHGCQVISLASNAGGTQRYAIDPQSGIQPSCPGCSTEPVAKLVNHNCAADFPRFVSGRSVCPFCRTKLSVDESERAEIRFCKYCGTPQKLENRFCKHCGKPNVSQVTPASSQTKDTLAHIPRVGAQSIGMIDNQRRAEIDAAREAEKQKRQAAAEAQRRAELERRKAEAENKRRLEAEALRLAELEKRKAETENKRRLEAEALRLAELEKHKAEAENKRRLEAEALRLAEQKRKNAEEARQQLERQKEQLVKAATAAPTDTSRHKPTANSDSPRTLAEEKPRADVQIVVEPKGERDSAQRPNRPVLLNVAAQQKSATASTSELQHKPTPQLENPSPPKERTVDAGPSFTLPAPEGWLAKATSWKSVSIVVLLLIAIGFAGVTLFGRKKAANVTPPAPVQPVVPTGMVYVPGGEFLMGNPEGDAYEKPPHRVTVKPFFIDTYEVTCELYQQFVKATGHRVPAAWTNGTFPAGSERKPVTGVDWNDANAFAQWAGKRLPTEEEWEFTARSGTGSRYPWGNEWKAGAANANGAEKNLSEVGRFSSGQSSFGTFDMVGNVWEWTATSVHAYPDGVIAEDKLPVDQREALKVIRGGCYLSDIRQATSTYRRGWPSSGGVGGYEQTGFRCARDVSK